ncbi:hypothetical protein V2J09_022160 [Rumex salicifolius]
MIETQFSTKIKAVQTDWGGEYRLVSTYLASHGILHRVSCTHTPQQKGSAERLNHTVIEKGLALLAHSNLPIKFWENAFHTACVTSSIHFTPPSPVACQSCHSYVVLSTALQRAIASIPSDQCATVTHYLTHGLLHPALSSYHRSAATLTFTAAGLTVPRSSFVLSRCRQLGTHNGREKIRSDGGKKGKKGQKMNKVKGEEEEKYEI